MAIIRPEILDALFTGAKASFEKGKPTTPSDYEKVATIITSSNESETYHWLGSFPRLRKWVGDRELKKMEAHGYFIRNETYESSVVVRAEDLADDKFGVYSPLFMEMGREAKTHPNKYVFEMLREGFNRVGYDGQYFFDHDHPVGDGFASNLIDGEGTPWVLGDTRGSLKPLIWQLRKSPDLKSMDYELDKSNRMVYGIDTRFSGGYGFWQMALASKQELTEASLQEAISKMRALRDEEGRPLGINPNILIVPPSLEWVAKRIVGQELVSKNGTTESNIMKGTVELLATEWLA